MAENTMARERFSKADNNNTKESVEAEGKRRVNSGIAESFRVEDGGDHWVLVTVLKRIS